MKLFASNHQKLDVAICPRTKDLNVALIWLLATGTITPPSNVLLSGTEAALAIPITLKPGKHAWASAKVLDLLKTMSQPQLLQSHLTSQNNVVKKHLTNHKNQSMSIQQVCQFNSNKNCMHSLK